MTGKVAWLGPLYTESSLLLFMELSSFKVDLFKYSERELDSFSFTILGLSILIFSNLTGFILLLGLRVFLCFCVVSNENSKNIIT